MSGYRWKEFQLGSQTAGLSVSTQLRGRREGLRLGNLLSPEGTLRAAGGHRPAMGAAEILEKVTKREN